MAKYRVLSLLWDGANERYIYPGEVIDLECEGAETLAKRGRIEPVENEIKVEFPVDLDDREEQ